MSSLFLVWGRLHFWGRLPSKGVFCQRLSSVKGHLPSKGIKHELCWILFGSQVSVFFITWSNIAPSFKSWTIFNSQQLRLLKMSKMKIPSALKAEKLPNEKRKQFCGTHCTFVYHFCSHLLLLFSLHSFVQSLLDKIFADHFYFWPQRLSQLFICQILWQSFCL